MEDPRGSCSVLIGGHTTSEGCDFFAGREQETNVRMCLLMNVLILERRKQAVSEEHRASDSATERGTLHLSDAAN